MIKLIDAYERAMKERRIKRIQQIHDRVQEILNQPPIDQMIEVKEGRKFTLCQLEALLETKHVCLIHSTGIDYETYLYYDGAAISKPLNIRACQLTDWPIRGKAIISRTALI